VRSRRSTSRSGTEHADDTRSRQSGIGTLFICILEVIRTLRSLKVSSFLHWLYEIKKKIVDLICSGSRRIDWFILGFFGNFRLCNG
jgi:hypothetical protein